METFSKESFLIGLREELECTICLDLSIPPIYSCKNGHILCGICYEKIKQCGLCKESFTQNDFAERLVSKHELTAPCRNNLNGCTADVQVSKMKDHLRTCEYAPLKCLWSTQRQWLRKLYSFEDYCQHLVDSHGALRFETFKPWGYHFMTDLDAEITDQTFENMTFFCKIIPFEGQTFIFRPIFKNGNLFWYIAIVGGSVNASKFKCSSFIYSSLLSAELNIQQQDCLCSWNLPILTLKEFSNQDTMLLSGKHASLHWSALQRAWEESVIDGMKKRMFYFKLVIKKT